MESTGRVPVTKKRKHICSDVPRLKRNMHPDCETRRSYELVIRRETETGKKVNECEICVKTTTDFSNLNKHCRIHTGEKLYKWDDCVQAFQIKEIIMSTIQKAWN